MKLLNQEQTLSLAAAKSGMDEKTARKYRRLRKLPSEMNKERDWRTREDSFKEMWEKVRSKLELNPGLQAKTLFKDLQRRHPGKFQDGQLRTLQRRVKEWRALEGPPKEVFFEQRHEPGELSQSDFTHMNGLGVRIEGQPFDHLLYHFVLTYSNWEWGTVCFSESFESLSMGFQNAVWKLGGASNAHQTDRLSAAVHQELHPEVFTQRYKSLLAHYGVEGRRIQAAKPNENGDIEQRHYRLKESVDQALMLRGSRDFESREDYEKFLERLFDELNSGRRVRLQEELKRLRRLPERRLESYKRVSVVVKRNNSTIRVDNNTYSVDSRLIGEDVEVRVHAEELPGVVRPTPGGHIASAERLGQASDSVSPHHRLAGSQTGSVRALPLPRRTVPDDAVSDGVRQAASTLYVVACHQGLSSDSAVRSAAERISGGHGPRLAYSRRRAADSRSGRSIIAVVGNTTAGRRAY